MKAAGILHEIPLIIGGGDIFGETPARPYHPFGAVVPGPARMKASILGRSHEKPDRQRGLDQYSCKPKNFLISSLQHQPASDATDYRARASNGCLNPMHCRGKGENRDDGLVFRQAGSPMRPDSLSSERRQIGGSQPSLALPLGPK